MNSFNLACRLLLALSVIIVQASVLGCGEPSATRENRTQSAGHSEIEWKGLTSGYESTTQESSE